MRLFRLRPEKHNGEFTDCIFKILPPAACNNCGCSFPIDYDEHMIFNLYWCHTRHTIRWNDQMCFSHIQR